MQYTVLVVQTHAKEMTRKKKKIQRKNDQIKSPRMMNELLI